MRTWADDFRTYEEACIYYGADTPAQIAAELEAEHQEWLREKALIEAEYGPYVNPWPARELIETIRKHGFWVTRPEKADAAAEVQFLDSIPF